MPENTTTVRVDLASRSYDIVVGNDILATLPQCLADWIAEKKQIVKNTRTACLITDANIAASHANRVQKTLRDAQWNCEMLVLEPGETSKRLDVIATIYDQLVAMKADRHTVIIAVGGGVIGDAAGFAAATYARGIPFVQLPTTLLAQVDSSVGGKVGINHPHGKNLIGAFYQPLGVLIDLTTLTTLPDRDYRSGLAEVIKYGVILDAEFFRYLEQQIDGINNRDPHVLQHVVARCCRIKADVVEQDEQERIGLRAVLNLGHTFAHAYETLSGYGELLHGEAVAIGMIHASQLAERLGRISADVTARQTALFTAVGLPIALPSKTNISAEAVLERMRLDKKTVAGKLRFVLPTKIGHAELVNDVPETELLAVLETVLAR